MLTPSEIQDINNEIDAGTFDLGDALDDIAVKQRGEDVRRAIYGGILLVNHEGKAGAVDVKVRSQLSVMKNNLNNKFGSLEKQIAEFIANNSGTVRSTRIEETTLMNSPITFTAAASGDYPTGATAVASISLPDVVTNYDYIEVEYAGAGRTQIARFTPEQLRQTAHFSTSKFVQNNSYTVNTIEVDDGDGTSHQETVIGPPHCELVIVNFRLDYDVADSLYAEANMWRWSGEKNTDGFIKSAITASDGVRIFRIRGIKYTQVDTTIKDSELTDMRVGYDDTEYSSAGEALRAQIAALWEAVNAIHIAEVEVDQNGYLRFDGGSL